MKEYCLGICINAKALLALRTSLFTAVLVEPPPLPSTHPKKSVTLGMWALALHRLREGLVSAVFLETQPLATPSLTPHLHLEAAGELGSQNSWMGMNEVRSFLARLTPPPPHWTSSQGKSRAVGVGLS